MFAFFQASRKKLRLLLLPLFALVLAACDPAAFGSISKAGSAKIDPNAPVPVALLVPRGGSSSDNLLAANLENAARLAMRDLGGVKIDLRVYGTAGSAANASKAAAQAVTEGAKIIIGPLYAEAANAAGVAAAPAGVNVLSFSNNPTIAGGNVFVLGSTFSNTANRLVGYAKRQGRDRIVVLHANDIAGQLGRNAINQAIAANGATIAGDVEYALSQESVTAAIPRVKAAVAAGKANAIFLTTNSATALPLFAQLLPEAGINPKTTQYIGLTRWDIPAQTLALPGVQGGWFALPDPAASRAFRSKYNAAYGSNPHPLAGLAFDGIAAVGALVKSGKATARDGTNERGLAVAAIRNKAVSIVEGAPQAFGGAGF